MTIEEIKALDLEQIEERSAAIAAEIESAESAEALDAIQTELTAIEERKAEIAAQIEERKKDVAAVIAAAAKPIEEAIVTEERKTDSMEFRNSKQYIEAYAKYVKTGNDKECRTLITEYGTTGEDTTALPVPTFVGDMIAERLEASEILRRVRKMYARGVVKVGFEIFAAQADIVAENGGDLSQEELITGIVTMPPMTAKKWVQISDEALDSMNGEAYLRYIYDEVTRGIIGVIETAVIQAIELSPATATPTAPAVQITGTSPANIADIVNARALLSSAAKDLVVLLSPTLYAQYRALQMSASYAVDVFDGLPVIINDAVDDPIVGDLSGVMVNYAKGTEAIEFKYDDKTLMTSDMVRVLGRLPISVAVVGNNYFARVVDG